MSREVVVARPRDHEQAIELALHPGKFIPDRECFSFVSDLEQVAAGIDGLTGPNPAQAVELYETFLAGCYEKVEELHDSSSIFGQFVVELFCGWIKARQAAGADPDETATRLLDWMDEDPHGFCYQLEEDASQALDKAGLAAFVQLIRARFDGAAKTSSVVDDSPRANPESIRRRWGESLRVLYLAQRDLSAYVAHAEETGFTAQDCLAIATLLVRRRKPEQALDAVNRGLALDRNSPHGSLAANELARLKRKLLTKLGREDEALAAAWADFCAYPSTFSYLDLMQFVPEAARSTWHTKAIDTAVATDTLPTLMDLLLETNETERLADLVRGIEDSALENLSHHVSEPVAETLDTTHPDLAARLWRAQGMRIVNAGKSRHYDAALSNLGRAKRCFERAGLVDEWQNTVSQVCANHHRKIGFMSDFNRLIAGTGPGSEPSFLERAKARWRARQRRDA
jgi:tetratricopeptide (TPR) repeat protein